MDNKILSDERIKSYEVFITNLKELKQAKLVEKAQNQKEELKALLASMSDEEKKMLNEYHAAVYEKVGMYLEENEREWLKRYTRPI